MIFLYIFLNSVVAELCCWYEWSNWEQPLTCGEVCKHRKRAICVTTYIPLNICDPFYCNHYDSCPNYETQTDSCETIPCRELIF